MTRHEWRTRTVAKLSERLGTELAVESYAPGDGRRRYRLSVALAGGGISTWRWGSVWHGAAEFDALLAGALGATEPARD